MDGLFLSAGGLGFLATAHLHPTTNPLIAGPALSISYPPITETAIKNFSGALTIAARQLENNDFSNIDLCFALLDCFVASLIVGRKFNSSNFIKICNSIAFCKPDHSIQLSGYCVDPKSETFKFDCELILLKILAFIFSKKTYTQAQKTNIIKIVRSCSQLNLNIPRLKAEARNPCNHGLQDLVDSAFE